MIPYPTIQTNSAIKAIDEWNMDIAMIRVNAYTDLELIDLYRKIQIKHLEYSLTDGTQTVSYSKYFLEAIYDCLFEMEYRIPYSKTYFSPVYVTGFDTVNKVVCFDYVSISDELEANRGKQEKIFLGHKNLLAHNVMIAKISKNGYNNLSSDDQSYWNSVY